MYRTVLGRAESIWNLWRFTSHSLHWKHNAILSAGTYLLCFLTILILNSLPLSFNVCSTNSRGHLLLHNCVYHLNSTVQPFLLKGLHDYQGIIKKPYKKYAVYHLLKKWFTKKLHKWYSSNNTKIHNIDILHFDCTSFY